MNEISVSVSKELIFDKKLEKTGMKWSETYFLYTEEMKFSSKLSL